MTADSQPTIAPHRIYKSRRYQLWLLFQRFFAIFMLVFLSPLFLILYILVKTTSKGPFFYCQERDGFRGQKFKVWKIRSMRPGSDKNKSLGLGVTSSSPEVTRVGKVLRKLKMDELPQLWNVVLGQMEFVGPRPIAPILYEKIGAESPDFKNRRLSVRPGLTNLGQVSIEDNETGDSLMLDWEFRNETEYHYLEHKSIPYDIILMGHTFLFLLRKAGLRLPFGKKSAPAVSFPSESKQTPGVLGPADPVHDTKDAPAPGNG